MAYLGFPVVYIGVLALLFDIPGNLCLGLLLSPGYWLISLFAMGVGYGLWEMQRWAWYGFVAVNVLIGYQNAVYLHGLSESHHKGLAFAVSLLTLAGLIYRLAREVRVPYFFPKIRWWESNPRYKLSVPVKFTLGPDRVSQGDILDLSLGGCFIKLKSELAFDDVIELEFSVFNIPIRCTGVVVWKTISTVTRPRGVGIKFRLLDGKQKRSLKIINRRLRKIAAFYRRSRYLLNQDEFIRKLEEMEKQPIELKKFRA
jgi:Tfp pilus assembly protein PilZ